jgi:hypothetical protein
MLPPLLPSLAREVRAPPVVWRGAARDVDDPEESAADFARRQRDAAGWALEIGAGFLAYLGAYPAAALLWVAFAPVATLRFGGAANLVAARLDIPALVIATDHASAFLLFFPDDGELTAPRYEELTMEPHAPGRDDDEERRAGRGGGLEERREAGAAEIAELQDAWKVTAGGTRQEEYDEARHNHDAKQLAIQGRESGENDPAALHALRVESLAASYEYAERLAGGIVENLAEVGGQPHYAERAEFYSSARVELEQDEEERRAGRGGGENPAFATHSFNIRPDVVDTPAGLAVQTTMKSADYRAYPDDVTDKEIEAATQDLRATLEGRSAFFAEGRESGGHSAAPRAAEAEADPVMASLAATLAGEPQPEPQYRAVDAVREEIRADARGMADIHAEGDAVYQRQAAQDSTLRQEAERLERSGEISSADPSLRASNAYSAKHESAETKAEREAEDDLRAILFGASRDDGRGGEGRGGEGQGR